MVTTISKNAPAHPPEVPRDETTLVSFSAADVPIQAVTVFCKNKAEVTRIVDFSSPSRLGRHEVGFGWVSLETHRLGNS